MQYKLIIPGTLPNLNDYLKAERQTFRAGGKFTTRGNEMKQNSQMLIISYIRKQLKGVHITKPVRLNYLFVEGSQKRDLDNICAFGHKVIQDSLVKAGILDNDGWKNIKGFTDDFDVDKKDPRIEVVIVEVD